RGGRGVPDAPPRPRSRGRARPQGARARPRGAHVRGPCQAAARPRRCRLAELGTGHVTAVSELRWRVRLSDIQVDDELADAVLETVRSGWWSMGPRVEELEREFAAFCDAPNAVAVANGTAALHLALLAVGCGRGDEVIVPSLNFVAAANAIVHTGAEPVFCDVIGPEELNLDPQDLADAVTSRTKAVLALHYAGYPCAMDAVAEIADRHGFAVVEDAAHAPGATFHGRMCGTLGKVGCFSFFSNKNLPIGEGGMIVTGD